MRDVLDDLIGWWQAGETVGMATVVGTWRSAPRPAGRVDAGRPGRHRGRQRLRRLRRGRGLRGGQGRRRDRRADAAALRRQRRRRLRRRADLRRDHRRLRRVGLPRVVPRAGRGRRVGRRRTSRSPSSPWSRARTTGWAGGWWSGPTATSGTLGLQRLDDAVADDARGMLAAGRTGAAARRPRRRAPRRRPDAVRATPSPRRPGCSCSARSTSPPPSPGSGAFLGYRVTVCDARPVFATPKRFPDADEVIVEWPHRYLQAEVDAGRIDERTVLCVLTHDPKFDVPLLEVALRHPGRLRRRDGLAAHPRGAARPGCAEAGLSEEEIAPAVLADRARPGRPHPGGDRGLDRRGDHRRALGRHGRAAGRHRRPDPPDGRPLNHMYAVEVVALVVSPVHRYDGRPGSTVPAQDGDRRERAGGARRFRRRGRPVRRPDGAPRRRGHRAGRRGAGGAGRRTGCRAFDPALTRRTVVLRGAEVEACAA